MSTFITPFPLPIPAPSLVSFLAASGLLSAGTFLLCLLFPGARTLFGYATYSHKSVLLWFVASVSGGSLLLSATLIWSALADVRIGFAWSAVYIAATTALVHVLRASRRSSRSRSHRG